MVKQRKFFPAFLLECGWVHSLSPSTPDFWDPKCTYGLTESHNPKLSFDNLLFFTRNVVIAFGFRNKCDIRFLPNKSTLWNFRTVLHIEGEYELFQILERRIKITAEFVPSLLILCLHLFGHCYGMMEMIPLFVLCPFYI